MKMKGANMSNSMKSWAFPYVYEGEGKAYFQVSVIGQRTEGQFFLKNAVKLKIACILLESRFWCPLIF